MLDNHALQAVSCTTIASHPAHFACLAKWMCLDSKSWKLTQKKISNSNYFLVYSMDGGNNRGKHLKCG